MHFFLSSYLEQRMSDIEVKLTALATAVDSLNTTITDTVNKINAAVPHLQSTATAADLATADATIAKVNTAISSLNAAATALDTATPK